MQWRTVDGVCVLSLYVSILGIRPNEQEVKAPCNGGREAAGADSRSEGGSGHVSGGRPATHTGR